MRSTKILFEDDLKEPVFPLATHRLPWLIVGLIGGIIAILISSYFEEILIKHISLAFFIPVVVYMADAVGTQTETIFVRKISTGEIQFHKYLLKELSVGILLGTIFGGLISIFAYFWFGSFQTALTVGIAMLINITIAPIIAIIIPLILKKEHQDPALGAGPFTTVIQDLISLTIYFLVASIIIFGWVRIL